MQQPSLWRVAYDVCRSAEMKGPTKWMKFYQIRYTASVNNTINVSLLSRFWYLDGVVGELSLLGCEWLPVAQLLLHRGQPLHTKGFHRLLFRRSLSCTGDTGLSIIKLQSHSRQ